MFEKQHETTIKSIHSDNGGEYIPVAQYAIENGIDVTRSAPYSPQANGIAEIMNRTLIEAVRTTFKQSGLDQKFWAEALANLVGIRNRIPKETGLSPHEELTGTRPILNRFRPFGCLGMVHLHESKRKKLDSKTKPCVLLRTLDHKNYRMYDIKSKRVIVSRHVTFTEDVFPENKDNINQELNESENNVEYELSEDSDTSYSEEYDSDTSTQSGPSDHADDDDFLSIQSEAIEQPDLEYNSDGSSDPNDKTDSKPVQISGHPYNLRERQHTSANICHEKTILPKNSIACHKPSSEDLDTPTLTKALRSDQSELWMQAISEEYESLLEAETWEVVQPPAGIRIFPSKFVFKIKRNSDGSIERYKARLVLLGHLQRPEVDFFDTYAPVVDFTAVRIALV